MTRIHHSKPVIKSVITGKINYCFFPYYNICKICTYDEKVWALPLMGGKGGQLCNIMNGTGGVHGVIAAVSL